MARAVSCWQDAVTAAAPRWPGSIKPLMQASIDGLFDEIASYPWFSEVGKPGTFNIPARPSQSWQESFIWCEHPVSKWCNIEGSLILHRALAKDHYERFRKWNDIARSIHSKADAIMADVVFPSVPAVDLPEPASAWIRSQIISAALEAWYRDCRRGRNRPATYRRPAHRWPVSSFPYSGRRCP
jgi:hypothetical protein